MWLQLMLTAQVSIWILSNIFIKWFLLLRYHPRNVFWHWFDKGIIPNCPYFSIVNRNEKSRRGPLVWNLSHTSSNINFTNKVESASLINARIFFNVLKSFKVGPYSLYVTVGIRTLKNYVSISFWGSEVLNSEYWINI